MKEVKRILMLKVPDEFFKKDYFEVEEDELRMFWSSYAGHIEYGNKVSMDEVCVDTIVKSHTGDRRIWYKGGGYETLYADWIMMKCYDYDDQFEDIFEWLEEYIPTLHKRLLVCTE